MKWVQIIRAEEDTIDWDILDWADARELWDEHYDKTQNFSLVRDILSKCPSAEVISEEYDFDLPGRSGVEYVIETNNPDSLKKEIIDQIKILIQLTRIDQLSSQAPSATINQDQIINFLLKQAVALEGIRVPAGYEGMAQVTVRALKSVAKTLSKGHCEKPQISALLSELIQKVYGEGLKADLRKIIDDL
jgi:hypothetical protein